MRSRVTSANARTNGDQWAAGLGIWQIPHASGSRHRLIGTGGSHTQLGRGPGTRTSHCALGIAQSRSTRIRLGSRGMVEANHPLISSLLLGADLSQEQPQEVSTRLEARGNRSIRLCCSSWLAGTDRRATFPTRQRQQKSIIESNYLSN